MRAAAAMSRYESPCARSASSSRSRSGSRRSAVARASQTAVLVGQHRRRDRRVVRRQPGHPAPPPPLPVARRVRRHREQPAAQVGRVAAGLEMAQELQKRLLDDVLGVLVVPDQDHGEAVDRRAVRLEQVPRRLVKLPSSMGFDRQRYNAGDGDCDGCVRLEAGGCEAATSDLRPPTSDLLFTPR